MYKSLIIIYNEQTEEEQATHTTSDKNGYGFSGIDGEFLTSLAKQYLERNKLSEKQLNYARKKMTKYANQLVKLEFTFSTLV